MIRGLYLTQSSLCCSKALLKHNQTCHALFVQNAHIPKRWATMAAWQKRNHYEILGLKRDATQNEIKDAFLRLSKECHPDLNPTDPHTHEKFVQLNKAYQVLSKPQSRREYDVSIAHHFYFQQNMARHGYTSHYPNSSNMPGGMGSSGPTYQGGDAENKQFWDETIFNMRKKSQGDFYPDDEYYGIKGVRKQSNTVVVFGCMVLITVGAIMHILAVKYSKNFSQEYLDKRDRINEAFLKEAKARAKMYGNEHQLQELKAKLEEQDKKRAKLRIESKS